MKYLLLVSCILVLSLSAKAYQEKVEFVVNGLSAMHSHDQGCEDNELEKISAGASFAENKAKDCSDVESKFKAHILSSISGSIDYTNKFSKCIDKNSSTCGHQSDRIISELNRFKKTYRKISERALTNWVKKNKSLGDLAKNCIAMKNGKVSLTSNLRIPQLKPSADKNICRPVLTRISHSFDQEIYNYTQSSGAKNNFSEYELANFNQTLQSPIMSLLSAKAKFGNIDDNNFKKEISKSLKRSEKMQKKLLKKLKKKRFFNDVHLYEFGSEFQEFAKTLPGEESQLGLKCIEKKGNKDGCFNSKANVFNNGKCASKFARGVLDVIPGVGMVRGLFKVGRIKQMNQTGLLSKKDSADLNVGAITDVLLNVPISMGVMVVRKLLYKDTQKIAQDLAQQLKVMTPSEKQGVLKASSELKDKQRIKETKSLLGLRFMSRKKKQAIIDAHNIALEKGYFNFSKNDLKDKLNTLTAAGFTSKQATVILRKGLAGQHSSLNAYDEVVARSYSELAEQSIAGKGLGPKDIMDHLKKNLNELRETASDDIKEHIDTMIKKADDTYDEDVFNTGLDGQPILKANSRSSIPNELVKPKVVLNIHDGADNYYEHSLRQSFAEIRENSIAGKTVSEADLNKKLLEDMKVYVQYAPDKATKEKMEKYIKQAEDKPYEAQEIFNTSDAGQPILKPTQGSSIPHEFVVEPTVLKSPTESINHAIHHIGRLDDYIKEEGLTPGLDVYVGRAKEVLTELIDNTTDDQLKAKLQRAYKGTEGVSDFNFADDILKELSQ